MHRQRHRRGHGGPAAGGGGPRVRFRGHSRGPTVRLNLHCRGRRCRLVRMALARHHRQNFLLAGSGEQRAKEKGATVASKVRLCGQQPEQVGGDVGMHDLHGRVRCWRPDPRAVAVWTRLPRAMHRHVARVPLLVPFLSAGSGGGQVPEVLPLPRRRQRNLLQNDGYRIQ
ncbi:hypothetical protein E2542_SST26708 [Spatholobus suberectus]|nr:hypothetical protein E2542_SST26708 [Spatholobus suberectus]